MPESHAPLLHVVLHEPEIPNNTGAIGRTCVATGCALHLIEPIAFDTDEKACRRAGLDYWQRLAPAQHAGWDAYTSGTPGAPRWYFSTRGTRPVWDADFAPGDHLVFGKETKGLPCELLDAHPERVLSFPMVPGERSLNLANAACAAVYEALRQLAACGAVQIDRDGRVTRP